MLSFRIYLKEIIRWLIGVRRFNTNQIIRFSKNIKNKKILEIGSGPFYRNKYYFSYKNYFVKNNNFECSDIDPSYGHQVVDITKMNFCEDFDIILCMDVLEHVFKINEGISRIYNALRPGGTVIISVPFIYPLHQLPHDFWRITIFGLNELLKEFSVVSIKYRGFKRFPFQYFIVATK